MRRGKNEAGAPAEAQGASTGPSLQGPTAGRLACGWATIAPTPAHHRRSTMAMNPLPLVTAVALLLTACGPTGIDRINHVVVIYLENRSFDNLYGSFEGAQGLSAAAT